MHPTIGYANERIEIFLAQGLVSLGQNALDEGEFLELVELSLPEAMEAVRRGELTDGKTLSALLWAEKVLTGVWA
jgi:ADP-ribose pyrophosphatase